MRHKLLSLLRDTLIYLHILCSPEMFEDVTFALFYSRFPMDLGANPSLMQDDMLEQHASMSLPFGDDLLLNQESALLAAKSPLLMGHGGLPMMSDGLLAEAQISQQLLAARRARKMLEARKLLEAKNMLAVQREAAQLMAAQEAAHQGTLVAPSRQVRNTSANFTVHPFVLQDKIY